MKKLNWLIFKSFLGPLVMSLAIILFILVLQLMAGFMDEIAGKGISLSILGKLFGYACGRLFLLALPVAVLAAALMTYGNMGEHNELTALKSSGIGLGKVARSMIFLGLMLTGLSFWFSFEVVPKANLKFFNLLYDIAKTKAELSLKPGEFYRDIDNYVIRISDRDEESKTLYGIMIYDHLENRGPVDVISADSAQIRSNKSRPDVLKMVLYAGVRHQEFKPETASDAKFNYGRTYFDSLHYQFKLDGFELTPTDEKYFSRIRVMLNQRDLGSMLDTLALKKIQNQEKSQNYIRQYSGMADIENSNTASTKPKTINIDIDTLQFDSLIQVKHAISSARNIRNYVEFYHKTQKNITTRTHQYLYEYHHRMAGPLHVMFFMVIGISLGAIIRKGGLGVPALISTFLLVLAYLLDAQGKRMAHSGMLDPVWSAWIPAIFFGSIALYLLYQAANESRLLEMESWKKYAQFFILNQINLRF